MIAASGRHTVKMPRCKRTEKPTVSDNQIAQLIALILDQRDKLILILAYHYGLSAEEVFGLTWDSIDDYVHIRNVAWHGTLYRDTTKREARRRDLPLHPDLKAMIARDPKSVQAIMGHSKPDMTANIYAQSQESKVAALLDARWQRLGLGKTKGVQ